MSYRGETRGSRLRRVIDAQFRRTKARVSVNIRVLHIAMPNDSEGGLSPPKQEGIRSYCQTGVAWIFKKLTSNLHRALQHNIEEAVRHHHPLLAGGPPSVESCRCKTDSDLECETKIAPMHIRIKAYHAAEMEYSP
jgi:hypothetical protein